jgi:tetratricopeptide (TPR) repeat protein
VSRLGRAVAATLLAGVALACTTPLELGERRYREGDRRAALEIWRSVQPDSFYYESTQQRIAEVEREFQQLVVRYKKRARYFEDRGRLAESILNYRLALELQPDDRETLAHVQELARTLAARRAEAREVFRERFEAGDLAGAREAVDELERLDPFSPDTATDARQVEEALAREIERLLARGRRGFSNGNHRAAERAFREVLALDPENESAQGYLSYIARIRSSDSARVAAAPAPPGAVAAPPPPEPREIEATDAEIRAEGAYQNALAAERGGHLYDAIRFDLDALRSDPAHAAARSHLNGLRARLAPRVPELIESGKTHYQQEDLQAALDQWRRALLIDPENLQAREYRQRAERLRENLDRLRSGPAGDEAS